MMSPNAVQSPVLGHAALLTPSTSTHGRTCCARLAGESVVLPYAIEKKCVRTAHEFPKVPIQAACREVKDIRTALAMQATGFLRTARYPKLIKEMGAELRGKLLATLNKEPVPAG